ncbi:thioredoxin [Pyrrhoderma noxium]|uniref:glutathione transferase n=1 Tax=Pyrrhoderma noxium TaxID=2282107 RepID=A0A286U6B1_9AGAM|nr:thioredoxin [Pyrrhoderma noxium]
MSTSDNAGAQSKIVVHHLENSRSTRILWLLEELRVPYELKFYKRTSENLAPTELKAIHPLGLSPIITDDDVVIAESAVIVEYLINKFGSEENKPSPAGWLDNSYFTHYCEGSFMPLLVNKLIFTLVPKRTPFLLRPLANILFGALLSNMVEPRIKTHLDFIEAHLTKSQSGWFANGPNPTSADYMMSFALEPLESKSGSKIDEYKKRVHARPAYQRALEKGGKIQLNFA